MVPQSPINTDSCSCERNVTAQTFSATFAVKSLLGVVYLINLPQVLFRFWISACLSVVADAGLRVWRLWHCLTHSGFNLLVDTPPLWCPEPSALPGHCPSGPGQGNRDPSSWSQTLSCGEPRSRWRCRTRRWCWTCRRRKLADGPMLLEGASEPAEGDWGSRLI